MSFGIWQRTITDETGNVLPAAEIEVREPSGDFTGAIVELFSNETGTAGKSNPFNADSEGFAQFYAGPQKVDIRATGAGSQRTWRNVEILGTAAIADTGTGAGEVPTNGDLGTASLMTNSTGDDTLRTAAAMENETGDSTLRTAATMENETGDTVLRTAAAQDVEALPWLSAAIGEPKAIFINDSDLYPPISNSLYRYIQLTEGLDASGQYNEGQLVNETITGSGVERQVTAEIATGPLAGTVVHLINSERSHLRPGETAGDFEQDQMQRITGRWGGHQIGRAGRGENQGIGAFRHYSLTGVDGTSQSNGTATGVELDSANSPDARTSETTDGETRVKSVSAIYFMRVA